MTRPPTSHFQPRAHTPDVHEHGALFEDVGRDDPLLEALYCVSLTQRLDVDAIDRALDAHLAAHGEPEQVAYAKAACMGYDRTFPLVEAQADDSDYVREHRAWNPLTQREIALVRSGVLTGGLLFRLTFRILLHSQQGDTRT